MHTNYVTKPLGICTVLIAGTNIDDYVEEGVYVFSYANRPSGLPSGVNGNGWLIVFNNDSRDYTKQIWISMGSSKTHDNRLPICMRGLFGESGYSEWSMRGGGGNKCLLLSGKGGGLNGTDLSFNEAGADKRHESDHTRGYGLFSCRYSLYPGGADGISRDRNAGKGRVWHNFVQKQHHILSGAGAPLRRNGGTRIQMLVHSRYLEAMGRDMIGKGVAA